MCEYDKKGAVVSINAGAGGTDDSGLGRNLIENVYKIGPIIIK